MGAIVRLPQMMMMALAGWSLAAWYCYEHPTFRDTPLFWAADGYPGGPEVGPLAAAGALFILGALMPANN